MTYKCKNSNCRLYNEDVYVTKEVIRIVNGVATSLQTCSYCGKELTYQVQKNSMPKNGIWYGYKS